MMPASSTTRPVRAGKVGAAEDATDVSASTSSATQKVRPRKTSAMELAAGRIAVTSVELHLGGLHLLLLDGESRQRLVARIENPGPEAARESGELGVIL